MPAHQRLREMTYGWPTEMIIKAIRRGCRIKEVPVHYRPRVAGRSKISGTVKGILLAPAPIPTLEVAAVFAAPQPDGDD